MERVELSKPVLDQYKYRTRQKEFIGGNPVTLEAKYAKSLWKSQFNVTPKVDGTRYLCIMDAPSSKPGDRVGKIPYFIDRGLGGTYLRVFQPRHSNGSTPQGRNFPNCILDGEIVQEKSRGRTRWIYWVFDILSFKGAMITHLSFDQRYAILLKELSRYLTVDASPDNWFFMLPKPYYKRESFAKDKDPYATISQTFETHCDKLGLKPPELDGLIFNDTTRPYVKGPWKRCDNIQFKWKPQNEQTIDVALGSGDSLQVKGGRDYVFNWTNPKKNKEYEIKLERPRGLPIREERPRVRNNQPLVAELRLTQVDTKKRTISTEFVRWREDKGANAWRTIDSVIRGYLNPIQLKDLLQHKDPQKILRYFTKKQLLRVLHQKDIFTPKIRKTLALYCKPTLTPLFQEGYSRGGSEKVVIRLPDKTFPMECIAERDFPKAQIEEVRNSKGEFIVVAPDVQIPKFQGANKMWAVSRKAITIKTNYLYNTPVEIYSMALKRAGSAAVANKGKIVKTIFRITGYTNIIFEKPEKGNPEFYIETYPGEKVDTLIRLIKMVLEL